MQKTKLGITIGMLSAVIYFTALFGGYVSLLLVVGYVLLFEQNDWLKRVCYKAVALSIVFSVAVVVVNLIPQALGCLSNFLTIFNGHISYSVVTSIVNMVIGVINILETVLFLFLGIKAFTLQDIKVKKIDKFIEKL